MIERLRGRMQLVCDECGAAQDETYDRDDFDVMMTDARAEGWRAEKIGADWCHYCPDCR